MRWRYICTRVEIMCYGWNYSAFEFCSGKNNDVGIIGVVIEDVRYDTRCWQRFVSICLASVLIGVMLVHAASPNQCSSKANTSHHKTIQVEPDRQWLYLVIHVTSAAPTVVFIVVFVVLISIILIVLLVCIFTVVIRAIVKSPPIGAFTSTSTSPIPYRPSS